MYCEACGRYGKHHPRCPYYSPPQPRYICCSCGEGIYPNEKYLENDNGEYIHRECADFEGTDWLVNWLGFEFKEENDD